MARGIYLRQEVQGWQPGANTVAYYPFTSETTVYDQSGNQNDLSNDGVTFGDYAQWTGTYKLYKDNFSFPSGTFYIGLWTNATSFTAYNDRLIASGSDVWLMYANPSDNDYTFRFEKSGEGIYNVGNTPPQANKWYYVFITGTNGQTHKIGFIDNGTMTTNTIDGKTLNSTGIVIGRHPYSSYDAFRGYMSELIIEDRAWTEQEIMDYFNLTKSNYGL